MSGRLRVEPHVGKKAVGPARHDHLVLEQPGHRLIYSDPRLFGRVRFHAGPEAPEWWGDLPPEVLSPEFTIARVAGFLARHARAPIKAVLLRQECFPGIGNWMADEALWRAEIHPRLRAGTLAPVEAARLRREVRAVARGALRSLGEGGKDLPRGWLFHNRWSDGGRCPRTGAPLVRESIGGRTTCWSRGRQRPPRITR
jgi:formamidopyrimidine-DNA glycosylase